MNPMTPRFVLPKLLASFVILLAFGFHQASAIEYHVDINAGNNSFPGTTERPFKTINHAAKVMEPGDKAIIHEGVYHEQIMGGKSGLPDAPITFEGVDRDKVVLRGSVTVKDWKKVGSVWFKVGLQPITRQNLFVMVDEKQKLKKVDQPQGMPEGSFCLDINNNYFIRLLGDADPNTDHVIDVYELDMGFNAGARYGGTAKKHIILRNMTLEKYGTYGVSAAPGQHEENSHWELDNLKCQFSGCGVFSALDDWYIHDCQFLRNAIHGCQIDGSRVRFINNISNENEFFGHSGYAGAGLLIGPNPWANSCEIKGNTFKDNGYPDGYGCAIYLEGRSHNNTLENNFIEGGTHAGICFYGSSYNKVFNNVLLDVAPKNSWELCAAFVIDRSREGAPTQSVGNLIAHNTVCGCSSPIALSQSGAEIPKDQLNQFVNNVFSYCRRILPKPGTVVAILRNNAWFSCPEETQQRSSSFEETAKRFYQSKIVTGVDTLDSKPVVGSDPGFKDITKRILSPTSNSPFVDKAEPLDFVTTDIDGTRRPQGLGPDIGAYELQK